LRDHKSQARRADLIIVTKCPEDPGPEERERILGKLKPLPHQKVVFGTLAYDLPRNPEGQAVPWEALGPGPVTLVTGIARPRPLLYFLHHQGISFTHRCFPDHHRFTRAEIEGFNRSGPVLTTEKDAVRLEGQVADCYVLGVRHHFGPADRAVLEAFLGAV
jgi:tetraacyldisaccharide 4'-kinase